MFQKISSVKVDRLKFRSTPPNVRVASRAKLGSFEYDERPGYLYIACRALTADVPNLNYDMFPSEELETAYETYKGAYFFLNHDQNPDHARGAVIDAKWHPRTADEDGWVEVLIEADEQRCPKLCSLLKSGEIDTFSMGTNCETTTCSVCGNEARTAMDFCEHIQQKGCEFGGKLAYEICHGLTFIEISAVYDPADVNAKTIEKHECAKTAGRMRKADWEWHADDYEYVKDYGDDMLGVTWNNSDSYYGSRYGMQLQDEGGDVVISASYLESMREAQDTCDEEHSKYASRLVDQDAWTENGGTFTRVSDTGVKLVVSLSPDGYVFQAKEGNMPSYVIECYGHYPTAESCERAAEWQYEKAYGMISSVVHAYDYTYDEQVAYDVMDAQDEVMNAHGWTSQEDIADDDSKLDAFLDEFYERLGHDEDDMTPNVLEVLRANCYDLAVDCIESYFGYDVFERSTSRTASVGFIERTSNGKWYVTAGTMDEPDKWFYAFCDSRGDAVATLENPDFDADGFTPVSEVHELDGYYFGKDRGGDVSDYFVGKSASSGFDWTQKGDASWECFPGASGVQLYVSYQKYFGGYSYVMYENGSELRYDDRFYPSLEEAEQVAEEAYSDIFGQPKSAGGGSSYANSPRQPDEVQSDGEDGVCPLCGSDNFDGEVCLVCGYQAPPDGFDDIELETEEDYDEWADEAEQNADSDDGSPDDGR